MNDTIVFTDCLEEITLKTGSVFEIKLEAIKGTGYQWLLKEPCLLITSVSFFDRILQEPGQFFVPLLSNL